MRIVAFCIHQLHLFPEFRCSRTPICHTFFLLASIFGTKKMYRKLHQYTNCWTHLWRASFGKVSSRPIRFWINSRTATRWAQKPVVSIAHNSNSTYRGEITVTHVFSAVYFHVLGTCYLPSWTEKYLTIGCFLDRRENVGTLGKVP